MRRRAARSGPPIVYRSLVVRRNKQVYPITEIGTKKGAPRRLHVVRGHFKTYTSESPLFGNLTGTFYWGPHLRGDESMGEVRKNYVVEG